MCEVEGRIEMRLHQLLTHRWPARAALCWSVLLTSAALISASSGPRTHAGFGLRISDHRDFPWAGDRGHHVWRAALQPSAASCTPAAASRSRAGGGFLIGPVIVRRTAVVTVSRLELPPAGDWSRYVAEVAEPAVAARLMRIGGVGGHGWPHDPGEEGAGAAGYPRPLVTLHLRAQPLRLSRSGGPPEATFLSVRIAAAMLLA